MRNVIVVAALLLAACGGAKSTTSDPEPSPAPPRGTADAAVEVHVAPALDAAPVADAGPTRIAVEDLMKDPADGFYLVEGVVRHIFTHKDCSVCPPRKRCYPCKEPHFFLAGDGDDPLAELTVWLSNYFGPTKQIAVNNRVVVVVRATDGKFRLHKVLGPAE